MKLQKALPVRVLTLGLITSVVGGIETPSPPVTVAVGRREGAAAAAVGGVQDFIMAVTSSIFSIQVLLPSTIRGHTIRGN